MNNIITISTNEPVTAEDITDEMVLTCFRHFPEIIGNQGAIDTAKPHIVDAVNAYLAGEAT